MQGSTYKEELFYALLWIVVPVLLIFSASYNLHPMADGFDASPDRYVKFEEMRNCYQMKWWLENNPDAWYKSEKIDYYNFMCEDKE